MRTFIVGTRIATPLGIALRAAKRNHKAAQTPAATTLPGTQFAVVSRGFSGAMQGYKSNGVGNGTLYGLFATQAQALAHQKLRKMQLYTSVVSW